MLTLYHVEWCPSCHTVRQVLTELGLAYTSVNVPSARDDRAEVIAVSGQASVPVLLDGDRVLSDTSAIVAHLRASYARPNDAAEHARAGAWRFSAQLSVSPTAAASQLRTLLEQRGFRILSETAGPDINETMSRDYVILAAVLPLVAAAVVDSDSRAPGGVLVPLSIAPTAAGGSTVAAADPVGQVWLFANAPLRKTVAVAKRHLAEIFASL